MGALGPLRGSPMVARRSAPDPLGDMTRLRRLSSLQGILIFCAACANEKVSITSGLTEASQLEIKLNSAFKAGAATSEVLGFLEAEGFRCASENPNLSRCSKSDAGSAVASVVRDWRVEIASDSNRLVGLRVRTGLTGT